MRYFYINKSGFVSVISFSIAIFSLLTVLFFSFDFYYNSQEKAIDKIKETELLNSLISFRSQILLIDNLENLSLNYNSPLDYLDITININSNDLVGEIILDKNKYSRTIPSLANFCADYTFYPGIKTTFKNTGLCIIKLN